MPLNLRNDGETQFLYRPSIEFAEARRFMVKNHQQCEIYFKIFDNIVKLARFCGMRPLGLVISCSFHIICLVYIFVYKS